MVRLEQKVRPHPEVVDTELDQGRTALLHLARKQYFSLNATASRIWQDLKRGRSLTEISQRLQARFEVDPERAERSVLALVGDLHEQDLVQVVD